MSQRVALVTSGAKGLGHATVRALLEAGWDVFFTYGQSAAEAEWLVAEARRLNRKAVQMHANLLDKRQVLSAVDECHSEFKRVDAFIHNFGPFVFDRVRLADYSDEAWDRLMVGNLHNFFWLYQKIAPGMRARGFGRVVTVGSDGASVAAGWHSRAAYAAAKSGLASLTRSIAREERTSGITANMVCPGDIRGDLKMRMIREVAPMGAHPVGASGARPPVGEDVGRAIAFLCDERSQQVNGTVMEVTGGQDIRLHDSHRSE